MWAQLQRFTSVFPLFCLRDFLREQQQQGYLQGRKKWLNVYCNYMFTIDAWYFTSRCLTLLFCFKILLQTTVHFLKTVSWWHLRERTTSPVLKEGIGSIQLYMSLIQLPLNWIIVLTSCYIMYFVKSELIKMTRAWDKEKSESPTRIEPIPSRTLGGAGTLSTEVRELTESKVI